MARQGETAELATRERALRASTFFLPVENMEISRKSRFVMALPAMSGILRPWAVPTGEPGFPNKWLAEILVEAL